MRQVGHLPELYEDARSEKYKKSDKVSLNEPRRKCKPAVLRSRIVVLMGGRLAEEGVASWTNKGRRNLGGK